MTENTSTAVASITMGQPAWSELFRALALSVNKTVSGADSTSFLSCTAIRISEDGVVMESESAQSTTHVSLDAEDAEFSGSGVFLLNTNQVNTYIGLFAGQDTVQLSLFDNYALLEDVPGNTTEFRCELVDYADDNFTPHAVKKAPEDAPSAILSTYELKQAYTRGCTMTKSMEKDPASGQSPLSGALVEIVDGGVQVVSWATSGAESFASATTDGTARALSSPVLFGPRLSALPAGEVTLSIGEDSMFYLESGPVLFSFSPLAIGGRSNPVTSKALFTVLSNVEHGVVGSTTVSAGTFFSALTKASTVKADVVSLEVSTTSLDLKAFTGDQRTPTFRQTVLCETSWEDPDYDYAELLLDVATVKKISTFVSKTDDVTFTLCRAQGGEDIAGVVVVDGQRSFDKDENRHNFFILSTTQKQ